MKNIAINILLIFALAFAACSKNDLSIPSGSEGKLVLDFSAGKGGTRAGNGSFEDMVSHIDLYMFSKASQDAEPVFFRHFRLDLNSQSSGSVALEQVSLEVLKQVGIFNIYAVANSSISETTIASHIAQGFTVEKLSNIVESTQMIHLTGSALTGSPDSFLMTGQVYGPDNSTAKDINFSNAVLANNYTISVDLVRAAAKVEINFIKGADGSLAGFGYPSNLDVANHNRVELEGLTYTEEGSYYLNNLQYKTWYMNDNYTDNSDKGKIVTGQIPQAGYFEGTPQKVSIVTYIYACSWQTGDHIEGTAPTVVVNLPAVVKVENQGAVHGQYLADNFYEIPLQLKTQQNNAAVLKIERNNHYVINAIVKAPGAQSSNEPHKLEPLSYQAYPWNETVIGIGTSDPAKFLTLNTYGIEMHNVSEDHSSVRFYSSSDITSVVLDEAYYYNKFDNKILLDKGDNTDRAAYANIRATATQGNNGYIEITSPLKTNNADNHKNTIRYLKFTVTNADGISKSFNVRQYPVVFITNQQGFYSYRTDFGAHYENISSSNNITSITYKDGQFSYNSSNPFWYSKVATQITTDPNKGASDIDRYYWNYNRIATTDMQNPGNARMYHIMITANSDEYIVGIPRLLNGVTDPGDDNKMLVSPSFMIASRLGVVTVENINWDGSADYDEMYSVFGKHCEQYVETYVDPQGKVVHLDDWRLPTEAELGIIMKYQRKGSNNESIDYLLNASYYFSASGPVYNQLNEDSYYYTTTSVRCVRDAYDAKTPAAKLE